MSVPLEELHKAVWYVKDTARMNNWEKRNELMALDLLFRSGYYCNVTNTSSKE